MASSLRPMIVVVVAAFGHELCGLTSQPTLETAEVKTRIGVRSTVWKGTYTLYSSTSKILCGSSSTATPKPASMSFFAVVGVKAARLSNGLVSHLSQSDVPDAMVDMG